jgi:hypothetical protein
LIDAKRSNVELLYAEHQPAINETVNVDKDMMAMDGRLLSESGAALLERLTERLCHSVRRLDDVYYALVEALRTGLPVPELALNA